MSSAPVPAIPANIKAARLAVSLIFLLNGILFASWVSRLPLIQTTRGLDHNQLGLGLLGLSFGALISMPTTGWLCAKYGSRIICIITGVGYAVMLPFLAGTPDGAPFFLSLFLFGIVHGAIDVGMNLQAVEVEKAYERPIMSSFHALFSGGGLIGSMLGGGFASLEITPFHHFSTVSALLLFMVLFFSFPNLLRQTIAPISSETSPQSFTAAPLRNRLTLQLVLIGMVTFACMLSEGAMADWTAIYMREFTAAPEALAAISYAAFSVTMMIGRLSGDHLILRYGAVKMVRYGGWLATAGMITALVFPYPIVTLLGFAAVGAGLCTVVPITFSAAGRLPGINASFALSTITTIGYTGFLIGPPAIGFLAHGSNLRLALIAVALSCAIVALLAGSLQLPPQRKATHAE